MKSQKNTRKINRAKKTVLNTFGNYDDCTKKYCSTIDKQIKKKNKEIEPERTKCSGFKCMVKLNKNSGLTNLVHQQEICQQTHCEKEFKKLKKTIKNLKKVEFLSS